MQYIAAAMMAGIYFFNIPVVIAFIWKKHRHGAGFGVFDEGAALRRAVKRMEEEKPRKKVKMKRVRQAAGICAKLLRTVEFRLFTARLLIGAGDAARTAEICGAAMALGSTLRALADRGELDIRPDFSGRTLEGEVRAVAVVKAGDIIKAAAKYALKR